MFSVSNIGIKYDLGVYFNIPDFVVSIKMLERETHLACSDLFTLPAHLLYCACGGAKDSLKKLNSQIMFTYGQIPYGFWLCVFFVSFCFVFFLFVFNQSYLFTLQTTSIWVEFRWTWIRSGYCPNRQSHVSTIVQYSMSVRFLSANPLWTVSDLRRFTVIRLIFWVFWNVILFPRNELNRCVLSANL